ncbi:MAG: nucleotidyltransferase domain-containing protein [Dehalococcoidia bacterium]
MKRFAERLQQDLRAERVLLFGSRARGEQKWDSDYDFIVVASAFEQTHRLDRGIGLYQLWYGSGGHGPTDLICMTPEEFDWAASHITLVNAVLPEAIDLLPVAVSGES